jgi:hypothetical protein
MFLNTILINCQNIRNLTGQHVAQGVKQQLCNREQTVWNLMDKVALDQGFLQVRILEI